MFRSLIHTLALALLPLLLVVGCSKKTTESTSQLTTEERLAAPANVEYGQRLFMACAVCHDAQPADRHRVGPNLWEIYGAEAAQHDDFNYSKALREAGIVWDDASLDAYIADPRTYVRGGRMSYNGEKDEANRRDIIAYLKTLK